jgi:hypothetical protein
MTTEASRRNSFRSQAFSVWSPFSLQTLVYFESGLHPVVASSSPVGIFSDAHAVAFRALPPHQRPQHWVFKASQEAILDIKNLLYEQDEKVLRGTVLFLGCILHNWEHLCVFAPLSLPQNRRKFVAALWPRSSLPGLSPVVPHVNDFNAEVHRHLLRCCIRATNRSLTSLRLNRVGVKGANCPAFNVGETSYHAALCPQRTSPCTTLIPHPQTALRLLSFG